MRLILSALALEDIALIHDYSADEWGEEQAQKYVRALWDALEEISSAPKRWRLRDDIFKGCRARVCGSHLVIFRERDGQVKISRVLHGAMNVRDFVPGNFMGAE